MSKQDTHYATLRRKHRENAKKSGTYHSGFDTPQEGRLWLYGIHAVEAALNNPKRVNHTLWASENALAKLTFSEASGVTVKNVHPKEIDKKLSNEAVHQGVLLETEPLEPQTLEDCWEYKLLLVLDQVTDPHNVGAMIRSGVAMGAGAIITTARHSPGESGVLAKVASGGLEHIKYVTVRNLANAIQAINERGYQTVGLDSEGPKDLTETMSAQKVALVMGAEGKGLRQKSREMVTDLARLDMQGPIKSLNVSNAAAVALFVAQSHLASMK
ncbi:MAG: 23S rRNA (guanosine(2251)-2'-O)-methyltransferase RlmB [Pseudomonadota bacterium]